MVAFPCHQHKIAAFCSALRSRSAKLSVPAPSCAACRAGRVIRCREAPRSGLALTRPKGMAAFLMANKDMKLHFNSFVRQLDGRRLFALGSRFCGLGNRAGRSTGLPI